MQKTALESWVDAAGWKLFGGLHLRDFFASQHFRRQLAFLTRHCAQTISALEARQGRIVWLLSVARCRLPGRASARHGQPISHLIRRIRGVTNRTLIRRILGDRPGNNPKSESKREREDGQLAHKNRLQREGVESNGFCHRTKAARRKSALHRMIRRLLARMSPAFQLDRDMTDPEVRLKVVANAGQ